MAAYRLAILAIIVAIAIIAESLPLIEQQKWNDISNKESDDYYDYETMGGAHFGMSDHPFNANKPPKTNQKPNEGSATQQNQQEPSPKGAKHFKRMRQNQSPKGIVQRVPVGNFQMMKIEKQRDFGFGQKHATKQIVQRAFGFGTNQAWDQMKPKFVEKRETNEKDEKENKDSNSDDNVQIGGYTKQEYTLEYNSNNNNIVQKF